MNRLSSFVFAIAVMSLLAMTSAFAAEKWTEAKPPKAVYAGYPTGEIFLDGYENAQGCASPLIKFTDNPQAVQALATAALLSGRKLTCRTDGCNGEFQAGFQCSLLRE